MKKVLLVVLSSLMLISFTFAAGANPKLQMSVNTLKNFYDMNLTKSQANNLNNYLAEAKVEANTIISNINKTLRTIESKLLSGKPGSYDVLKAKEERLNDELESVSEKITNKMSNEILSANQFAELKAFAEDNNREIIELVLSDSFLDLLSKYIKAL